MSRTSNVRWAVLVGFNVLMWCVLSFQQASNAAPKADKQPFANAVAQREETIAELKAIREELQTQTALFQSGKLKVTLADPAKRP